MKDTLDKRTVKKSLPWAFGGQAAIAAVLVLTVLATVLLGADYRAASELGASGSTILINYNDHLLVRLGLGTQASTGSAGFQQTSLRLVQERVLAMGALYSAVASVPLALFATKVWGNRPGFVVRASGLFGEFAYLLFCIVFVVTTLACGMPIVGISASHFLTNMYAIKLGCMLVGLVLVKVSHKRLAAALAVPAIVALFAVSLLCECSILAHSGKGPAPIAAQEEAALATQTGTDAFVFDPVLGSFEQGSGINQAAAVALEVLNPFAGVSLQLAQPATALAASTCIVYFLRGLLLATALQGASHRWDEPESPGRQPAHLGAAKPNC